MYKLGVIGGMGPLATVNFYEKVILCTEAHKDSEHIDLVVLNHASIPDRTECIINGTKDEFLSEIKKDFAILENIGVDVVAIPCNTSHYFFDDFRSITTLNIINMVEETIIEVKRRGFSRAAVFGTLGTVNSGVYERYAKKNGIEIVETSSDDRDRVMDIIYQIKSNNDTDRDDFKEIVGRYCDKETIGIIACTELSLIKIVDNVKIIDALDVLVKKSIEFSGKKYYF